MLGRYLAAWFAITLVICVVMYARGHIAFGPMPDRASQDWAFAFLTAAASRKPLPAAPDSARTYRAAGPILVTAYDRGRQVMRYVGGQELVPTLERAVQHLDDVRPRAIWRVLVTRGEGPVLDSLPGLSLFSLVATRDGLAARTREKVPRTAYLTPDDLMEREAYDTAVRPPIPDLTFGTALPPLFEALAEALDIPPEDLRNRARVTRVAFTPLTAKAPLEHFDRDDVLAGAREHTRYVLRHQTPEGQFKYIYDARHDREPEGVGYSLARHAGTAFFLAQAARELQMPEARLGALRALEFMRANAFSTCGGEDRVCAVWSDRVEFGASALAALAGAQLVLSADDGSVRELLKGLLGFLRAQQRPDGELMHDYDREANRPIDVQRMYYSGEAALALLAGYEALGDPRDKTAAARVMKHLTGAGWTFFGSRYFYGEEHWTCQAVARAARHMDVSSALDFCLRWGGWQRRLQYQPGQTPWDSSGAYGVGPVLLPRVTMAASRVEALVPIYRVLQSRGQRDEPLRNMLERSVGLLLRMRWDAADAHLFARPSAAMGGMPSTLAQLTSRVDMVQHSGSALLAWADLLTHPE